MSIVDKVKNALGQHSEKVHRGVDKIGDKIDEKTGGKHSQKINRVQQKVKDMTDRRSDQPGDRPA
ncbi:MAG: hypothetical protein JWO67_1591 [Streptosporangiaceae bacterium]|nr:hypothetical protein [Streptosporangiaceae bacterium]